MCILHESNYKSAGVISFPEQREDDETEEEFAYIGKGGTVEFKMEKYAEQQAGLSR